MEKDTLRMQFLSGIITEGQYKVKLQENVAVAEVRRAMEAAIAKIKNPADIERRINNVKFVVYNSLDPNTNGGERPPSDFQFDDAWWDSTHSQATDSVIASIYGELDAAVKGKSFGEDPMNENKSLNESMIGGIVGIGAINQIPPRAKADYETAFEHFLGGKYGLNEVEIEEAEMPAIDSKIANDPDFQKLASYFKQNPDKAEDVKDELMSLKEAYEKDGKYYDEDEYGDKKEITFKKYLIAKLVNIGLPAAVLGLVGALMAGPLGVMAPGAILQAIGVAAGIGGAAGAALDYGETKSIGEDKEVEEPTNY